MCFLMSFVGSVLHIWVLVLAPLNLVPRLLFTVFCQLLVSLNFMFMSLIRSLNYRINSELQKPPDIAIVTNGSRFSSFRWRMAWYIMLDILPHSTESSSVPRMWTRSVKCMNKFKLHDWDHVMHNAMIQWRFSVTSKKFNFGHIEIIVLFLFRWQTEAQILQYPFSFSPSRTVSLTH